MSGRFNGFLIGKLDRASYEPMMMIVYYDDVMLNVGCFWYLNLPSLWENERNRSSPLSRMARGTSESQGCDFISAATHKIEMDTGYQECQYFPLLSSFYTGHTRWFPGVVSRIEIPIGLTLQVLATSPEKIFILFRECHG